MFGAGRACNRCRRSSAHPARGDVDLQTTTTPRKIVPLAVWLAVWLTLCGDGMVRGLSWLSQL